MSEDLGRYSTLWAGWRIEAGQLISPDGYKARRDVVLFLLRRLLRDIREFREQLETNRRAGT